ncbi:MAG: NB-ARC domain-containing protein, partial [Xanthobacteraceae bacterium]
RKYYVGIESIIPVRNRVMHSRPLEFEDLAKVTFLAEELIKSHRSLWANLRTIQRTIAKNPEFVATLTIPELAPEQSRILHNLPQVEFDDTGFVGREKELHDLKTALSGSYPVVTVVGEGGLGKTALALKACYDLLDEESELDAIVWTTAKATKLNLNEIQVIEGAISSSLGIIESATTLLGRQNSTSVMDDLLMHLSNNKILLVIDNLETVIDHLIRDLVRRIPSGSRILFTTRIGLGAFDFPIPMSPLPKKAAAFYFRRVCHVGGVRTLASESNQIVDGYCEKLQFNPLFIKWFVHSVRAGKRPTVLTTDPKIFLQFCLQNVFNSLSADARLVAGTLASVGGSQSVASLAFFTDLDSLEIQSALSILITSNLVSMERGRTAEDEDRYMLSPFARLYIQKFIRPPIEEQRRLIAKQNILRSAQEEYAARVGTDVFDINAVYIRDKDDYIVAKILTRAIERIFKNALDDAEHEVTRARGLSPNYFEVHRVDALLNIAHGDYVAAESSYETALSLAPNQSPLRVRFAGFLSRQLGDQNRALEQLLAAEELAPNSAHVKLECARVFQYLRRFIEAHQRLKSIADIDKLPARMRRIHLDLSIQNELRKADYHEDREEFVKALECLEVARATYEKAPSALIDEYTIRHIGRTKRLFPALSRAFRGLSEEERFFAVEQWVSTPQQDERLLLEQATFVDTTIEQPLGNLPNRGRLANVHQNYAFIDTGSTRYFFHRGEWKGSSDFTTVGEGVLVDFDIGESEKGICAVCVRLIKDEKGEPQYGDPLSGKIKVTFVRHGFITLDRGGDLFFHSHDCTTPFHEFVVGDRVSCMFSHDSSERKRGVKVKKESD